MTRRSPARAARRVALAASVACVLWGAAGSARADEPTPPSDDAAARAAHLGQALGAAAASARDARLTVAWTQLGLGAALVPVGAALLARGDEEAQLLGLGLVIGGSVQLATGPLGFIPTRLERVQATFEQGRRAGVAPGALVDATERDWSDAAASMRRARPWIGGINLALGVAALALGAGLLLEPSGGLGMSRQNQFAWGSALVGMGGPFVLVGSRFAFVQSPEEASWDAYRGATGRGPGPAVSLGAGPGAAGMSVTARF